MSRACVVNQVPNFDEVAFCSIYPNNISSAANCTIMWRERVNKAQDEQNLVFSGEFHNSSLILQLKVTIIYISPFLNLSFFMFSVEFSLHVGETLFLLIDG